MMLPAQEDVTLVCPNGTSSRRILEGWNRVDMGPCSLETLGTWVGPAVFHSYLDAHVGQEFLDLGAQLSLHLPNDTATRYEEVLQKLAGVKTVQPVPLQDVERSLELSRQADNWWGFALAGCILLSVGFLTLGAWLSWKGRQKCVQKHSHVYQQPESMALDHRRQLHGELKNLGEVTYEQSRELAELREKLARVKQEKESED